VSDVLLQNLEHNLDSAKKKLAAAAKPVSFTGAGLSAESGIPVFRGAKSSDDGRTLAAEKPLWEAFKPEELASPEGFARNPELVLDWYGWRRQQVAAASPNPAHLALAAHPDMLHITQNVDDLLERAGTDPERVLHLHGELNLDRCHHGCGYQRVAEVSTEPSRTIDNTVAPTCPECAAPLRPGVVWFGEALPDAVWQAALEAVEVCDVMLVVGTSASVYPAAGLIDLALQNQASVIVVDPGLDTLGSNGGDSSGEAGNPLYLKSNAGDVLPKLLNG